MCEEDDGYGEECGEVEEIVGMAYGLPSTLLIQMLVDEYKATSPRRKAMMLYAAMDCLDRTVMLRRLAATCDALSAEERREQFESLLEGLCVDMRARMAALFLTI